MSFTLFRPRYGGAVTKKGGGKPRITVTQDRGLGGMSKKLITMGALALVFGGLSVAAADYWLRANVRTVVTEVPVSQQVDFGTLVVAAEPVTFGTKLGRTNLREMPWPKDAVPEGAFSTIEDFLAAGERSALMAITVNEPILAAKVSGPDGKATLSNRLRPGFRAMSISVNSVTGVAGFVVPGDRVDVVLTREMDVIADSFSGSGSAASEDEGFTTEGGESVQSVIVAEGATVLTVDQIADDSQTAPVLAGVVTLELDAASARRVSAAENAGSLSLHLRKAGETAEPAVAKLPFTMPKLFSVPAVDPIATSAYEPVAPVVPVEDRSSSTITVRHGEKIDTFSVRSEGGR